MEPERMRMNVEDATKRLYNWLVVLNIFLFSSLPGEMIQFDEHIFQRGLKPPTS